MDPLRETNMGSKKLVDFLVCMLIFYRSIATPWEKNKKEKKKLYFSRNLRFYIKVGEERWPGALV